MKNGIETKKKRYRNFFDGTSKCYWRNKIYLLGEDASFIPDKPKYFQERKKARQKRDVLDTIRENSYIRSSKKIPLTCKPAIL